MSIKTRIKFSEARNKMRKRSQKREVLQAWNEGCYCLKGKLTLLPAGQQPGSLYSQPSGRNVCLTEPVLTWPLEGGAPMNSAMLGEMQAFSTFFLPFYQPLKTEWISSVKVLRDEPDLTSQGVSLGGGLQVGELCPLYWTFWAETARPALTTCRTLTSYLFSIRGGTSTTWEAFWGPVPASFPPSWLPCLVGWDEEGEASVGKTSLGIGGHLPL